MALGRQLGSSRTDRRSICKRARTCWRFIRPARTVGAHRLDTATTSTATTGTIGQTISAHSARVATVERQRARMADTAILGPRAMPKIRDETLLRNSNISTQNTIRAKDFEGCRQSTVDCLLSIVNNRLSNYVRIRRPTYGYVGAYVYVDLRTWSDR